MSARESARAAGYSALPRPDMISGAGTGNPMDRETRYAGCKTKTSTDKEQENEQ